VSINLSHALNLLDYSEAVLLGQNLSAAYTNLIGLSILQQSQNESGESAGEQVYFPISEGQAKAMGRFRQIHSSCFGQEEMGSIRPRLTGRIHPT